MWLNRSKGGCETVGQGVKGGWPPYRKRGVKGGWPPYRKRGLKGAGPHIGKGG